MAGTVLLALVSYAGLDVTGPVVGIEPRLPAHWRSIGFNIGFRGNRYFFEIGRDEVRVRADGDATVNVGNRSLALKDGEWASLKL